MRKGLEIMEVEVEPAHSPIPDNPPRECLPANMEKMVTSLEAMILSMSKDVKSIAKSHRRQDSNVHRHDPVDIFLGRF